MEEKKKIIKKIVMSRRRLLTTSKFMGDTKLGGGLMRLHKTHMQFLKQLLIFIPPKISIASERLTGVKERTSEGFWETNCLNAEEHFFKSNFRMSQRVFSKLCELLSGPGNSETNPREAIPLEKKVAISLYALGSTADYGAIAKKFGVEKSGVSKILLDFCAEAWRVLAPMYLQNFPLTKSKIGRLVQEFEAVGFPQCMGALDACHFGIHPSTNGHDSVILLALVDARSRFIYVSCGPGGSNNSQIYQQSSLKQQLDNCNLLVDLKKRISGIDVPVFIIGDLAFQLSDNLMKPYPSQALQIDKRKCFNYAISRYHRVAKYAFAHLKARFIRIGKDIENTIRNANVIILSCCALHNFLNENNDEINQQWLEALGPIEGTISFVENTVSLRDRSNNPERIRNAISTYLFEDSADGGEFPANGDCGEFSAKGDCGEFSAKGDCGEFPAKSNDGEECTDTDDDGSGDSDGCGDSGSNT